MSKLTIKTAEVFAPLLEPARYKGAYGGRGSGKSHFFAELMIDEHLAIRGHRSLCIREVQKTLKESAKLLIEDKINTYKLQGQGFKVYKDVIETPGDGLIAFAGMKDHTAESIKSYENFSRAWVEESQIFSAKSLQLLRPTIRAEGSELWFSWNPRRKIDPVDRFLRDSEQRPSNSIVVKANYSDNPWFPNVLEEERLEDFEKRPDSYAHVWEGDYVTAIDGAYFAKHLAKARAEKRIGRLNIDPLMGLYAFFDIGGTGAKSDAVAIWIVQFIGKEIRVVDYYEAVGQELSEHVGWLNTQEYQKAKIYLPHDGTQHDKVYRVTYESELKKAGFKVEVVKNQGAGAANHRIEAVRRIFHQCWFDQERCSAGLEALGWYHEKKDESRDIGLGPEHDWSSHGADAFGLMAIVSEYLTKARQTRTMKPPSGSWMGM